MHYLELQAPSVLQTVGIDYVCPQNALGGKTTLPSQPTTKATVDAYYTRLHTHMYTTYF